MRWKAAVAVGTALLILTVIGLVTGASPQIIVADALGALASGVLAVMFRSGGAEQGRPVLAVLSLLVVTWLAVTAHTRTWLLALTLVAMFIFGFVALTSTSRAPRR
jgi:hypothetical protein